MSNQMTLDQFCDLINSTCEWEDRFSDIINANGWEDETDNEYNVCNDCERRISFNGSGTAVIEYL